MKEPTTQELTEQQKNELIIADLNIIQQKFNVTLATQIVIQHNKTETNEEETKTDNS